MCSSGRRCRGPKHSSPRRACRCIRRPVMETCSRPGSAPVTRWCWEIDGDDEVAVEQAPDGEWEALTWPVVNLRHVLERARDAGILDDDRTATLLAAPRAIYYPQRTTGAVWAVCRRQGETEFARWLAGRLDQNRHFGDLKRADALAAVAIALDGRQPPTSGRLSPSVWEDDVLQALVQCLHPRPSRWTGAVHRGPARLPAGLRPGLPAQVGGLPRTPFPEPCQGARPGAVGTAGPGQRRRSARRPGVPPSGRPARRGGRGAAAGR
ncbi:TfuA-like protein [Streptomyces lavendulae]|uniref:TfuA-like protein n=1 Tax=Streptomyces lavendulae TaxID=1914 RepID=UPI0036E1EC31